MTHLELKTRRKELGLTQEKLAQLVFRTKDAVAKWESGKYPIPKHIAVLLNSIEVG